MLTLEKSFSILLLLVFTILSYNSNSLLVAESKFLEFSADLIHRDSAHSPFYNPSLTRSQRVERVAHALRRSIKWSTYSKDHSRVLPNHGEFLVRIFVGTPPTEAEAIIDTGSDLSWIQCKPCTKCFTQKTPIFDPSKSSTYRSVPCNSTICTSASIQESSCDNSTSSCKYSANYADRATFSKGNLFTDELKLNTSIFHQIALGCGHENGLGAFEDNGSGIIGFGGGPNSFITQIKQLINGKFSYCLVSFESKRVGRLHFGKNEVFSSNGVVSTPLVKTNDLSTFYYVTLTGCSILNESINIVHHSSQDGGNMLIDSGTTLTNLPLDIYNRFESLVKRHVNLPPVDDPQGILSLCYNITTFDYFPNIVFNLRATEGFKGDLRLRPANAFVQTSDSTMCLAFSPVENGQPAVLGNLAQMNMFVGFDLVKETLSFQHTHCGTDM